MPKVEWVRYRTDRPVEKLEYDCSVFRMSAEGSTVIFRPKIDFDSIEVADRAIQEFLRSFEADALLRRSEPVALRFDQGRESDGRGVKNLIEFRITVPDAGDARRRIKPWEFSSLSTALQTKGLVKAYEGYRAGKDRLTTVAYLVLSHVQNKAKGRAAAARHYMVDKSVLDLIGRLSSEIGGIGEGRKIDSASEERPLRPQELHWLECATRMLITRIYETDVVGTGSLPVVSLQSLPALGLSADADERRQGLPRR